MVKAHDEEAEQQRLAQLHKGLERDLGAAWQRCQRDDTAMAVLYRHSIRGPIAKKRDQRDVPITAGGKALAQRLGRAFPLEPRAVWSSPMLRCTQSADAFGCGATTVQTTRELGDPGPFVSDETQTWNAYIQLGKHELVRRIVSEEGSVRGYRPLAQGIERLFSLLLSDAYRGACVLGFSHDIIMATLLGCVRGRALALEEWPEFHEGIVLERAQDGRVLVHYREQHWVWP